MRLAAVIVTYNRLEKLKKSLTITLNEDIDWCIVVNNYSTDGTKEWLESLKDERLIVINLSENIGGAGGFHVGMKYVVENLDVDWICCFDDDAYPSENTISIFKRMHFPSEVGSVASAVYLANGEISEMNRPSYNPFWSLPRLLKSILRGREGYHIEYSHYQSNRCIKVDASSFVGFFVRSMVIRKVGLPMENLFIYGDDIIYTLRIRKNGYLHMFCPNLKFIHDCSTFKGKRGVYKPIWKAYYTYRNGIIMYREAAGLFWIPLILIPKIISWIMMSKYYENRKLYRKILFKALKDGLLKNLSTKHEDILQMCYENET